MASGKPGLRMPRVLVLGCHHPASYHLLSPTFPTACGYFCHSTCAPQAPPCPVSPDLLCTALGVHPKTGTGTAYEGFLSVSWGWGGGSWVQGAAAWQALPCLPSPGAAALGRPAGLAAGICCPQ